MCQRYLNDNDKHPIPEPAHPDIILNTDTTINNFHPVLFDSITAGAILRSALNTEGAEDPLDALCWRRLCTAFGEKSNELCSAFAAFTRRITTTYVDPSSLTAYTSCCLDKCPSVRPVRIGEVVCRIIGKVVMKVVKHDFQEAIDSIQDKTLDMKQRFMPWNTSLLRRIVKL